MEKLCISTPLTVTQKSWPPLRMVSLRHDVTSRGRQWGTGVKTNAKGGADTQLGEKQWMCISAAYRISSSGSSLTVSSSVVTIRGAEIIISPSDVIKSQRQQRT
jgi:hypothetical protein